MRAASSIEGGIFQDNRGIIRFVNDFNFEGIKRFYQVENHKKGFVRAWQGHKTEEKYVYVSSGTALVAIVPIDAEKGDLSQVKTFILTEKSPSVLHIPAGYYNGVMNFEDATKIILFSNLTLEESQNDFFRRDYDYWDIWGKYKSGLQ